MSLEIEFQIGGDYHEGSAFSEPDLTKLPKPTSEKIILIGDVGTPYLKSSLITYKYFANNWKKVYIVMGNAEHECYWRFLQIPVEAHVQIMKDMITAINTQIGEERLILLHHTYVDFPTFRLAGCTFWSNGTQKNSLFTEIGKSDALITYDNGYLSYNVKDKIPWPTEFPLPPPYSSRPFSSEDLQEIQKKEELFIQQMMNECKLKNLRLIMCSHYIPTKNIPDVGSFIIQKYDLYDYLGREFDIKEPIIAWICGHVHKQQTIIINDIPIYINQDKVIV
jgi:UDP-2,3-diacylglucosamine pyrophosphatase LpxH